jgi:hypothetical protein
MQKQSPIEHFYASVQNRLMSGYASDSSSGPPIKGPNRETFVRNFLERIFPKHIRFGGGVIIDHNHNCSGQCDIVAEWPWGPSLQIDENSTRYYFADLVAAVVSIKSDVRSQWAEICAEVETLKTVDFTVNPQEDRFSKWERSVPFFAVGYKGFSSPDSAKDFFLKSAYDHQNFSILSIETGVYISGMDKEVRTHSGWEGLHCFVTDLTDKALGPIMEPALKFYLRTPEGII